MSWKIKVLKFIFDTGNSTRMGFTLGKNAGAAIGRPLSFYKCCSGAYNQKKLLLIKLPKTNCNTDSPGLSGPLKGLGLWAVVHYSWLVIQTWVKCYPTNQIPTRVFLPSLPPNQFPLPLYHHKKLWNTKDGTAHFFHCFTSWFPFSCPVQGSHHVPYPRG